MNVTLNFTKPKEQAQQSDGCSGKNITPQIKKVVMVNYGKWKINNYLSTSGWAAMQGKKVGLKMLIFTDQYSKNDGIKWKRGWSSLVIKQNH